VDLELTRIAQAERRPGERLLWAGRPGAVALARSRLGTSLSGLLFAAIPAYWVFGPLLGIAGSGNGG
jgi:hypothetical protein